ncbi:MAG: helix-turn-helix transcriptional regulator [Pasteurellaceae bacterium]|nr:helix-turn-helix transcriptional regulator [Pasteurellaceae bacterium]
MKTNEKIRQLRENRQWTQEDMADKLSMSKNGYAKIERGDTRSNLRRLEQIAEVFGIDIMELLSYGEDAQIQFNNLSNNESVSNTFFALGKNSTEENIQALQLTLSHKDEIIKKLENEIRLLEKMNRLLEEKFADS